MSSADFAPGFAPPWHCVWHCASAGLAFAGNAAERLRDEVDLRADEMKIVERYDVDRAALDHAVGVGVAGAALGDVTRGAAGAEAGREPLGLELRSGIAGVRRVALGLDPLEDVRAVAGAEGGTGVRALGQHAARLGGVEVDDLRVPTEQRLADVVDRAAGEKCSGLVRTRMARDAVRGEHGSGVLLPGLNRRALFGS